jgi:hypothetical protein
MVAITCIAVAVTLLVYPAVKEKLQKSAPERPAPRPAAKKPARKKKEQNRE